MHSQAKKIVEQARAVKGIGIEVQELLRQESDDRIQRGKTLQMFDLVLKKNNANIVTKILEDTKTSLLCLAKQSKVAIARENGLRDMVERKQNEIKRNRKLLASLSVGIGVEPAQTEYEQIEDELQVEYERYVVKRRNLDYLESELRSYHSILLQQRERGARRMILRGERGDGDTEPSRSSSSQATGESLSSPSCNDSDLDNAESKSFEEEDCDSDSNF